MKKYMKIIFWIMLIFVLMNILMTTMIAITFWGGGWVYITERCTNKMSIDEWMNINCQWKGNDKFCRVESNGISFETHIDNINFETLKMPCKAYEGDAKVFIRREIE